jgi:NAD(P)-dependent dehydrogenase (short-subunit alcohol dehydrogenase family)
VQTDSVRGTVLVVGVTGSIGNAIARKLLSGGWGVLGIARHASIEFPHIGANERFQFVCADATSESSMREVFASVGTGSLDFCHVVYAAGRDPDMDVPLADYAISDWHATLDTYVSGFLICFQQSLRVFPPGGHILAIGSAVTRFSETSLPPLFVGHYSAAKAALNELCKWGRREAHARKLLLSRVSPSAVDVPFHQNAPDYRRPPATVPLNFLTNRINEALDTRMEVDEEIIATPEGIKVLKATS